MLTGPRAWSFLSPHPGPTGQKSWAKWGTEPRGGGVQWPVVGGKEEPCKGKRLSRPSNSWGASLCLPWGSRSWTPPPTLPFPS